MPQTGTLPKSRGFNRETGALVLVAKSGCAAELHVRPGMVHVFPANFALLQAAREALEITGEFLRSHLGR
jgi:acetyl esterase/lipase